MKPTPAHQRLANIYAKATYLTINEPYLFFGFLDWRYGLFALLGAVLVGQVVFRLFHPRIATCIAFLIFQSIATAISVYDESLPLVWFRTLVRRERKHICPFTDEEEF